MKSGSKVVKIIGKKKVSKYTAEECKNELARLENDNSKYKKDIEERLLSLHM